MLNSPPKANEKTAEPSGTTNDVIVSFRLHKVILAISLLIYIASFYPGAWTPDPMWSLMQIRGLDQVNNWHPPVITLIWHGLWLVLQNLGMMWLAQTLLFFYSAFLISRSVKNRWMSLAILALLVLAPPIMSNFAIFWKDNWYIIFGLLAFGFLYRFKEKRTTTSFVAAILFSSLFFNTRYNAFVAAAPLFFALSWLGAEHFLSHPRWRQVRGKIAVSLLGCLLLASSSIGFNGIVSSQYVKYKYASWQIIPFYDMTGVSVRERALVLPKYILESKRYRPTLGDLDGIYNPTTSDPLVWTEGRHYGFPIPNQTLKIVQTKQQLSDIMVSWFGAMIHHPRAYLSHRKALFLNHLGVSRSLVHAPYACGISPNAFGWTSERTAANIWMYAHLDPIAHGGWFRGINYLVLTLLLCVLCLWLGSSLLTMAFVSSALLTFIGNFFLLGAADFRYLLWAVIVCAVAPWLILSETLVKRQRHSV